MSAMTTQHIEEAISRAHVRAIAGAAGLIINNPDFDYKMDGEFRDLRYYDGNRGPTGFPLDFQLKASKNCERVGDQILYDIETTAYNFMAARNNSDPLPMILILCCLHEQQDNWVNATSSKLTLQECCYWDYFEGDGFDRGQERHRIYISDRKLLTPQSLRNLMNQVNSGEKPNVIW